MGNDEHGPAYPETVYCPICSSRDAEKWCMRDNCPGRNPIPRLSPAEVKRPYRCPICDGNENRFMTCDYPGCPDGCDQWGRFKTYPSGPPWDGWATVRNIAGWVCALVLLSYIFWPHS